MVLMHDSRLVICFSKALTACIFLLVNEMSFYSE